MSLKGVTKSGERWKRTYRTSKVIPDSRSDKSRKAMVQSDKFISQLIMKYRTYFIQYHKSFYNCRLSG